MASLWFDRLSIYRDRDHYAAHHVLLLEVPPWTVLVCVMTPDAGLGNSPVGIDRLQVHISSVHDSFGIGTIRVLRGLKQPLLLELSLRQIPFIDRPEADKPVSDPGPSRLPSGPALAFQHFILRERRLSRKWRRSGDSVQPESEQEAQAALRTTTG